jgi:cytochrome c
MRCLFAICIALLQLPAAAEMRGHGGPVRAIAISPDGKTAITGSFDTTVIVWDLERETARQVLRFHEGPVNGVALVGGSFVTASDDGRIALWTPFRSEPLMVLGERGAPVLGFTGAGDVAIHAIHADRTVRVKGAVHKQLSEQPTAISRTRDGIVVSTADAKLRLSPSDVILDLPANANALAAAPDGEIIAGGADGKVYVLAESGSIRLAVEVQELPITSLAVSVDGKLIAAAGLRGAVTILDRATGKTVSSLVGPGLPVWSLAFHPDGKTLYTGGADRMVRKWEIATGQPSQPANAPRADFPPAVMNERGAQVFRACEACHTVTPDGGNRAGPTLHGVFGRRIGTAKDYAYSPGFAGLGIVWDAQTIARLFREGPAAVTPGTKMPEQKVTDEEDLQALVAWLEKVTR